MVRNFHFLNERTQVFILNLYDVFSFSKGITTTEDNVKTETKIEFIQYGTRSKGDKSGAYLFLPGAEQ